MDHSTAAFSGKVDLVLGFAQVPVAELSADEWLTIINTALDACKPYFGAMSQRHRPMGDWFEPIGRLLNCSLSDYDDRQTPESVMEFPEGISQSACCKRIASLRHDMEGSIPGDGVRFTTTQTLLLSQAGEWLKWEFKCERVRRGGLGYRQHRTGVREVAQVCRFSLVEEDELLALFKEKPDLGMEIIRSLHYLIDAEMGIRAANLQQIQGVEELLAGIQSRINQ